VATSHRERTSASARCTGPSASSLPLRTQGA
jgi:hypothetical protein